MYSQTSVTIMANAPYHSMYLGAPMAAPRSIMSKSMIRFSAAIAMPKPPGQNSLEKRLARRSAGERGKIGTANGNRTRILALKGLRANRCTIAASDEMRPHNYTGNTWNLHPTMALERSAISALDLNAGQP